MRNIQHANARILCCEQAEIPATGLSVSIPVPRLDSAWGSFQSSIVRAFARRQRREALRARLIERAIAGGGSSNE